MKNNENIKMNMHKIFINFNHKQFEQISQNNKKYF